MGMDKYLKLVWFVSVWIIIVFNTSKILLIEAAPKGSLITKLPGFTGKFPSKHYSGYVRFHERNLFYYFIVSERNPATDAVVLWLNGGPGCSSLDGFVYEHGPFKFQEGKPKGSRPKLHLNPYSWSKVSNIIYLDSPCGVGLSYSKNVSIYRTSDLETASDTHTFLLKGYLVGNGVTKSEFDGIKSLIPFAHGMGLISDDLYEEIQSSCKGNFYSPSASCDTGLDKLDMCISQLNTYDILEPCFHDPEEAQQNPKMNSSLPRSFQELGKTERPLKVRKRMFGRAWPLWKLDQFGNLPSWPHLALQGLVPCVNDEVATVWLNDESVRKAIHAEPKAIAGKWELCSSKLQYKYTVDNMIPYHKALTTQGYRALIYSGDHDMCVPFTGTEAWTRSIGYKVVDEWRPWFSNGQVSGYLQGYDKNLIFLTVKGAGHTVPEYKPKEALNFYTRWLDGKLI